MSNIKLIKLWKPLIDLINESAYQYGSEPIAELIDYLASLSPYEIIAEAKKDGFVIKLDQAQELSRQLREIVNQCCVDD